VREHLRHALAFAALCGALFAMPVARLDARAAMGAQSCAPHTTFATACALGYGTLTDALPAPQAVNYYAIAVPAEGQAVRVRLSGAAALHAALLRDGSGAVGPTLASLTAARPPDAASEAGPPVPGEDLSGAPPQTSVAPYPAPFEDTPFEDTPFEDTPFEDTPFEDTAFGARGLFPLQVLGIAAGSEDVKTLTHFIDALDAPQVRTATLVLAVWSPSGSTAPYTLDVAALAPEDTCQSGALAPPPLPDGFALTGSAAPVASGPARTLILTSEERWARYYGLGGREQVMRQLQRLAQQPSVQGVVISVDGDAAVQQAYAAWDTDRCSATLANAVAARIKALLQRYQSDHPGVRYLVLAGGDDILPFFRVPDAARIANERQYVGQTGLDTNSAGAAAYARGNILTDDYYTDPRGALSGSGLLFTATLPTGRLVESPDDVTAAVQAFVRNQGRFNATSALVTGYDFLQRTASDVGDVLGPSVDALDQLNGNDWSGAQLLQALGGSSASFLDRYLAAPDPPDLVFFSGHFTHGAMQTAQLDALRASALGGLGALSGRIFFTLGCHGGASVADADADPSTGIATQDWAQTILGLGGTLIGNTGYGYGDSDVPAYGQELMTTLARYLVTGSADRPVALGDALLRAKRLYRARQMGKWDTYHDKTLMEATLYGLPMVGLAVPHPQPPPSEPAPLQGTLGRDGETVVLHVEVDAPQLATIFTSQGSYLATPEGVDIRALRPVQPQLTFQLPDLPGLHAHGVVVRGGTFITLPKFDPVIVRPMWDVTEPEPQFFYPTPQPANLATLTSLSDAGGSEHQYLALSFGQFVATDIVPAGDPNDPANPYVAAGTAYPHVIGTETVYQHLSLDIYYSASNDQYPPDPIFPSLCPTADGVRLQLSFAHPLLRLNALVTSGGTVRSIALASGDGLNWSGSAPGTLLALVAIDPAGDVAYLSLSASCSAGSGSSSQTPRPRGGVRIGSVGQVGGPSITLTGTWGTGGPRCDAPGAVWLLSFYATGPSGAPNPNARTIGNVLRAPCSATGDPTTWTTQLPASDLTSGTACVALFYGTVGPLSTADAIDCAPLSGGGSSVTQPPGTTGLGPPSPSQPPPPSPQPTPPPVAGPPPRPGGPPTGGGRSHRLLRLSRPRLQWPVHHRDQAVHRQEAGLTRSRNSGGAAGTPPASENTRCKAAMQPTPFTGRRCSPD